MVLARLGAARLGEAWRGKARQGPARQGLFTAGCIWRRVHFGGNTMRRVPAVHGMAGLGGDRHGKGCLQRTAHWQQWVLRWQHHMEWLGKAWQGKARQGKGWQQRTGDFHKSLFQCGHTFLSTILRHGIMKIAKYTITGITPLLMHSERLANPFDSLTKELKAISGKRKKTEDDLLAMARIEFIGGLYHDDDAGIHVPGYNILATIVGGGKIHKLGTAIKRSVIVNEDKVAIDYDGPKTPAKLFDNKAFVDMRSVKVGTAKITRCRPKFSTWAAKFSVSYDENSIQKSDIDQCITSAGLMVGLGDYRPRFGRFSVAG